MREYQEIKQIAIPKPIKKKHPGSHFLSAGEWLVRGLGFLLAWASLMPTVAPFGIAFLTMERRRTPGSLVSLLWVVLGYLCFGNEVGIGYIISGVIYMIGVSFCREREGTSLTGAVLLSQIGLAIPNLGAMLWYGIEMTTLLQTLLDGGLAWGAVLALDRCKGILRGKRFFLHRPTTEEKLALWLLAGLSLLGLQCLPMPVPFSLGNVAGIGLIGAIAVAKGASSGGLAGMLIGFFLGIGEDFLISLCIFACCGIGAGAVSRFGRWAVVLMLTGVGTALSCIAMGEGMGGVRFYELALGAVFLAFLPEGWMQQVGRFTEFGFTASDTDRISRLRLQERLELAAGSFDALAVRFTQISDKKHQMDMEEIAVMFDTAADRVCRSCSKMEECWKVHYRETSQTMFRFLEILERKGVLEAEETERCFYGKCLRKEALTKEVNRLFEIYKINQVWKNKLCENRSLISQQFSGISDIFRRISAEIEETAITDSLAADEIAVRLRGKGISLSRVQVFAMEQGRRTVELLGMEMPEESVRHQIPGVLKSVLGGTFLMAEDSENRYYEKPELTVAAGFATGSKQEENGDSYSLHRLRCGKFLAVLSDGMGCGTLANRESSTIVTLLEDFMEAGFDKTVAVRLINSVMVMKSVNEAFATVDMCMIDLDSGEAEFVKNGAEASYIKGQTRTETVRGSSLPVGMVSDVEIATFAHRVIPGDVVVMASDGLEMKQGHEGWLRRAVKDLPGDLPVQEMADRLMEQALALKGGVPDDDMTVLVLKIQ